MLNKFIVKILLIWTLITTMTSSMKTSISSSISHGTTAVGTENDDIVMGDDNTSMMNSNVIDVKASQSSSRALMAHKTQSWEAFMSGAAGCIKVVADAAICGFRMIGAGLKCVWSVVKCIIPKCSKCCGKGWFKWACVICKCKWSCSTKTCKKSFKKAANSCKITTDSCSNAFKILGRATQNFFKNVGKAIAWLGKKIIHAAKWVAEKAWAAVKWIYDKIKAFLDMIKLFEVAKSIGNAFKCFGKLGSRDQIKSASNNAKNVKDAAEKGGKNGVISKIDSVIPGFKAMVCCMQKTAIGRVLNKWGKKLLDFHKNWKGLKVGSFIDDPALVVSLAAGVASGVSVGTSLDIAISTAFNIGLYWTICSGFVTDVGASVSIVVNLFRKFTFIPGQSVAISFSVGIPSTPIGVGVGVVLPIGNSGVDFGAVNVEVGASNGVSPVSIGGHTCDTKTLVEFNLLELLGNILTANNECPQKISGSAPAPSPASNPGSSSSASCAAWQCSCQGMSDKYGTNHGVTWGSAPSNARSWWSSKRCTTRPKPKPQVQAALMNAGKDCWGGCRAKQGKCSWCGTAGYCCRRHWKGNGCDGVIGGPSNHQCVKAPLVNLAKGKPTSQSSTGWGGSSARAVDGNTSTSYGSNSCTHTHLNTNPWWQVDLGKATKVTSVKIYNRMDCCSERLQNIDIKLSNDGRSFSNVAYKSGSQRGRSTVTIAVPSSAPTGRYLRIQLRARTYLTLCEVQVYGSQNVAPAPPPALANSGRDCWGGCRARQGKCSWCGTKGYCCRRGWVGNGCDGVVGGPSNHQCVNGPPLKNNQRDCWGGCRAKQGWCAWCGSGICCRRGWRGNGCDGSIGGPTNHRCVKGPGTIVAVEEEEAQAQDQQEEEEEEEESRRLEHVSREILTNHKSKVLENADKQLRDELEAKRRLKAAQEEEAEMAKENEEMLKAMESDQVANQGDLSKQPKLDKPIEVDNDMCGKLNIEGQIAWARKDGWLPPKKTEAELRAKLCSENECLSGTDAASSQDCQDARVAACLSNKFKGGLDVEKCCNLIKTNKVETLIFRTRQYCAKQGNIKAPSREEFCECANSPESKFASSYDCVNKVIDGCVEHYGTGNACEKLKDCETVQEFAATANTLCKKSKIIEQYGGAFVIGLGVAVSLITFGIKRLRNSKSTNDIAYEKLPDF